MVKASIIAILFFNIKFGEEFVSILRSGFVVSFFTLISRVSGLMRELSLAYIFGSGYQADCINVALKLPNLFRRIFAEGALSTVFIPMYNKKILQGPEHARIFAGEILGLLLCVLGILIIIMQIFMPQIMLILAPGFSQDLVKFDLAILLCTITTPYLVFISSAALIGGMLNSIGKFKAFAAMPIILNIIIIISCWITTDAYIQPKLIAIAIVFAGMLQLLFMYINSKNYNLDIALKFRLNSKDSIYLIQQMLPAILSAGINQISLFISLSIASFINGAISILSYAERIYQFPLSLIGTAFATVLLPEMSRLYNNNQIDKAIETQQNALKFAIYICLPCCFGISILSDYIIDTIYKRGAFTTSDCILTARCLCAFSIGLPAFILNKIFTPIFYANNDQKTPLKITIYSLLSNIIFNILLIRVCGMVGIAIGSSIAAWLNVCLLYYQIKKNFGFEINKQNWQFIIKVLASAIIMASVLIIANNNIDNWFYQSNSTVKILILGLMVILGAIIYLLSNLIFGILTIQDLNSLRVKISNALFK